MARPTARTLLGTLTKKRLTSLAAGFGISVSMSWKKDTIIETLTSRKPALAALLGKCSFDELKACCRAHGLADRARSKMQLLGRILDPLPGTQKDVLCASGAMEPHPGQEKLGQNRDVRGARIHPPTYRSLALKHRATGQPVEIRFRASVEFGGRADRATHNLHPYPGKLLPQVAAFIIEQLTSPGELVLDPFCGSGTVAVEAAIAGRRCIAIDQNPFACLLARVKTTAIPLSEIQRAMADLERFHVKQRPKKRPNCFWDVKRWYPPNHLKNLYRLRASLDDLATAWSVQMAEFMDVAFLVTARSVSLADPAYSVPVRLCRHRQLSPAGARHLQKLPTRSVMGRFEQAVQTAASRMAEYQRLLRGQEIDVTVKVGDTRTEQGWGKVEAASLILTSPPYPGAQKYVRASFPALEWLRFVDGTSGLGYLQRSSVGRERYNHSDGAFSSEIALGIVESVTSRNKERGAMLHTYFSELTQCVALMSRNVTQGGRIAIVVSPNSVTDLQVPTPEITAELFTAMGWSVELHLVDDLATAAQPSKRHPSAGQRIIKEHVIIARKGRA